MSYYFPKINLNVVNLNFTNNNEKEYLKITGSDKELKNMNSIDTRETTNDKSQDLELDDLEEKHRAEYKAHLNCQKLNWEVKNNILFILINLEKK